MKNFFKEFKEFIMRGNVVDMAVGVIIGSAFGGIITAFTSDFINPLINLIGGAEVAGKIVLRDAVMDGELVVKTSNVKFDATVEVAVKTNANPKYNDQMLRWTTILPFGTWKTTKVAVFVSDDKLDEAKKSWADVYGSSDLLAKLKEWVFDFACCWFDQKI